MKHGAFACLAATLIAGCADTTDRRQQQTLTDLQHLLPGAYSSTAAGASASSGADTAVSLTISPLTAQLIGDAVYFVRETPADNSGLVLWQGVWTLTAVAPARGQPRGDVRIVQHSYLFKEPRRWASAGSNPELLQSVLPQDLQALSGCDLVWRQTAGGFETVDSSSACHPGAQAKGLWVAQQASLEGASLSLMERLVDDGGALDLRGAPLALHLSRTGAAP